VAALSKTQVHGHFTDGIAGSNSAEGMDIRLLPVVCSVGSGLCGGLIIRPEDSYRVYVYLIVWDPETSKARLPSPSLDCGATEDESQDCSMEVRRSGDGFIRYSELLITTVPRWQALCETTTLTGQAWRDEAPRLLCDAVFYG